jgi:hypothetical protein
MLKRAVQSAYLQCQSQRWQWPVIARQTHEPLEMGEFWCYRNGAWLPLEN